VDLAPQEIMDKLLIYMMKQLTIRDFTKLSDPAQCKNIIIFMATELDKAFYQLKVLPTRSATNTLSFRKVSELIAPTERKDIEHRQGLCLTLAYFYTVTILHICSHIDYLKSMLAQRKMGLLVYSPGHGTIALVTYVILNVECVGTCCHLLGNQNKRPGTWLMFQTVKTIGWCPQFAKKYLYFKTRKLKLNSMML
jgi:hypothetical protein